MTLAIGFLVEAPTAGSVEVAKDTIVTVGLVHWLTSLGEASALRRKPGMFWDWRQTVRCAFVSASVLPVPVEAAYSAASRVADSSVIQAWNEKGQQDGQENREFGHGLTSVPARAVARCRRPLVSLSGAVQGWQGEHVGGN